MKDNQESLFDTQALRFIKRVDTDELSAFNESEFASPEEAAAYQRVAETWHAADLLGDQDIDDLLALDSSSDDAQMQVGESETTVKKPDSHHAGWLAVMNSQVLLWGSALLVVFAVGLLTLVTGESVHHYQVAVGDQEKITLKDGSELIAASNSQFSVTESRRQRAVDLRSGNLYLEVAPNAGKPFVVTTGNSQVQVVGTAFNVYSKHSRDEILVTHGKVRVSAQGQDYLLTRQQKLVITPQDVSQFHVQDTDRETAWRTGRLYFNEEPLSRVLERMNDYYKKPVLVDANRPMSRHKELGSTTLSGAFSTQNMDEFLAALEVVADVKIDRSQPDKILLY